MDRKFKCGVCRTWIGYSDCPCCDSPTCSKLACFQTTAHKLDFTRLKSGRGWLCMRCLEEFTYGP